MLRPASPKVAPLGFTQVFAAPEVEDGEQNAAVLNHSDTVGLPSVIGWPVTLARREPLTPRLMSTLLPNTRGVNHIPDATVKSPLSCQLPKMCDHAPFCAKRWFSPKGKSAIQLPVNLWRWSKLERPRSAAMSKGFCATITAPPPMEDASSMDLEKV